MLYCKDYIIIRKPEFVAQKQLIYLIKKINNLNKLS